MGWKGYSNYFKRYGGRLMGRGFETLGKTYGGIVINGVTYVWDYEKDNFVKEEDYEADKAEWARKEKAKYMDIKESIQRAEEHSAKTQIGLF